MSIKMIAVDMDGTLIGPDGQVSARNLAAMRTAEREGVEVVVATGRRHSYAMKVLRGLGLNESNGLITSNGAVVRTVGAKLLGRTLLSQATGELLCRRMGEFRNALLLTFDRVKEDGDDTHGALVVEEFAALHESIGKWMAANQPYIEHVTPIEDALGREGMIQMMLCGTIARMRAAEAQLLEDNRVLGVGMAPLRRSEVRRNEAQRDGAEIPAAMPEAALHRTEYPERDLCIVDILPAGCSKGMAVMDLAERRGLEREQVLAIGDNWNDVSMLDAAGSAVLMGNAPEDLRQVAGARGWVLGNRHDADGVADAIEAALSGALEMPAVTP